MPEQASRESPPGGLGDGSLGPHKGLWETGPRCRHVEPPSGFGGLIDHVQKCMALLIMLPASKPSYYKFLEVSLNLKHARAFNTSTLLLKKPKEYQKVIKLLKLGNGFIEVHILFPLLLYTFIIKRYFKS